MAGNRVYAHFTLFNVRITDMRHLWEPSREFKGKAQDKPNYMVGGVVAKTRANWWEEPTFAPAWAAYQELLQKSGMTPEHILQDGWPIKNGDLPPEPGKAPAEWAKGHWVLRGNSQNPIATSIVQNGAPVPLMNKVGVKSGDHVALAMAAAISQQNARVIKHFCNTVMFMAPGEEIAIGNGVSSAELMQQAQAQGLQVVGFGGIPGGQPVMGMPQSMGFPAAGSPQAGFPQPGTPMGPGSGFAPPMGSPAPGMMAPAAVGFSSGAPATGFPQPGMTQPASAPAVGSPAFGVAPAPLVGTAPNAAFPSSSPGFPQR